MTVQLIALKHLDPRHQERIAFQHGVTLGEMVAVSLPDLPEQVKPWVRVIVGGEEVPAIYWDRVRPRPNTAVVIRVLQSGANLQTVLSLAITVAAVAVGQFYLGPLLAGGLTSSIFGAGITGFGGAAAASSGTISLVSSLTVAALAIGGNLLLNAFIPGRQSQEQGKPLQTLQGLRNAFNPNGAVPQNLGRFRFSPPYAAAPYTENIGNDQYVVAMFNFGHGPLSISNIRLGDTPLSSFANVQTEIRYGYASDTPLSLYPRQVLEDAMNVRLKGGQAVTRISPRDVTGLSLVVVFPAGLIRYDKEGKSRPTTVHIQLRYRLLGTVPWTTEILSYSDMTPSPFQRGHEWAPPVRGQYEIELTRSTVDHDDTADSKIQDRTDLILIRGFRPEYPLDFPWPIAILAVRIKATEQLNGTLDNLNADIQTIAPDWNGSSWVETTTSNPAALFRLVLQGQANAYPRLDNEIDLDDLQEWSEFCSDNGLTYNRTLDGYAAILDVLADIAAAGRARPHDRGDKWSVVVDRPQSLVIGHITPRNSFEFQGTKTLPKFPDGFLVQFNDEDNGYQTAERIVPWPGFVGEPVVTQGISLPGKTNAAEVYREARRRQYELIYRSETYTVSQDFERLILSDGSLCKLAYDTLDREQIAGRIKVITGNRIVLDEIVTMQASVSYACRIRHDDMTSVLVSVVTVAGDTNNFDVIGSLAGVAVGDLCMFGPASRETIDVLVKSVEGGENLSARLTLVPYAPEIDTFNDATDPPAWDGRVGEVFTAPLVAPGIPAISFVGTQSDSTVLVLITPAASAMSPATYTVAHRLSGGGAFTEVTAPAASGGIPISVVGNAIEIKVKATSIFGAASAYSEITVYFLHIGYTADTTVPSVDRATITSDSF